VIWKRSTPDSHHRFSSGRHTPKLNVVMMFVRCKGAGGFVLSNTLQPAAHQELEVSRRINPNTSIANPINSSR
jgi:hypothetical protein